MKITSITGVKEVDNIKVFKPVSKLFIKSIYSSNVESDPLIRVRLVDGRSGRSDELVPEMRLSVLSEIASKYEGFQRRAHKYQIIDGKEPFDMCSILLGAIVGDGVGEDCAAIDLSNDKYLDIDLRDMNSAVKYEVWGLENHIISPNVRTYRKFYLSAGELDKGFHVEGNELLVYPMKETKEIQFYAKNGASPIFRKEELILDEDVRNDLVTVELDSQNVCRTNATVIGGNASVELPIRFGYHKYGVVDLRPYVRFDLRREVGNDALMFLMVDTIPSLPTSVANTSPVIE